MTPLDFQLFLEAFSPFFENFVGLPHLGQAVHDLGNSLGDLNNAGTPVSREAPPTWPGPGS